MPRRPDLRASPAGPPASHPYEKHELASGREQALCDQDVPVLESTLIFVPSWRLSVKRRPDGPGRTMTACLWFGLRGAAGVRVTVAPLVTTEARGTLRPVVTSFSLKLVVVADAALTAHLKTS